MLYRDYTVLIAIYMGESLKFENPELILFKSQNLHYANKIPKKISLNDQLTSAWVKVQNFQNPEL